MNIDLAAEIASLPSVQSLPPRKRFFALSYIASQNATKAAEDAGYKPPKTKGGRQLTVQGGRLLSDAAVREAVREGRELMWRSLAMGPGEVLARIARIARYDQRKLEAAKSFQDLDDDTAEALQGIKRREEIDKNGQIKGRTTEVKIASKLQALELLAKYHRLLQTDATASDVGLAFAEAMDRASKRASLRDSAIDASDAVIVSPQTTIDVLPSSSVDQFAEGAQR